MSEITLYEAQAKKMQGNRVEHYLSPNLSNYVPR